MTLLDRFFFVVVVVVRSARQFPLQALIIVNNRSLEDALAIVFGEAPLFPSDAITSMNGASIEQVTQVFHNSVRCMFRRDVSLAERDDDDDD